MVEQSRHEGTGTLLAFQGQAYPNRASTGTRRPHMGELREDLQPS